VLTCALRGAARPGCKLLLEADPVELSLSFRPLCVLVGETRGNIECRSNPQEERTKGWRSGSAGRGSRP
jgi:hypothetical protein